MIQPPEGMKFDAAKGRDGLRRIDCANVTMCVTLPDGKAGYVEYGIDMDLIQRIIREVNDVPEYAPKQIAMRIGSQMFDVLLEGMKTLCLM